MYVKKAKSRIKGTGTGANGSPQKEKVGRRGTKKRKREKECGKGKSDDGTRNFTGRKCRALQLLERVDHNGLRLSQGKKGAKMGLTIVGGSDRRGKTLRS